MAEELLLVNFALYFCCLNFYDLALNLEDDVGHSVIFLSSFNGLAITKNC